VPITRIKLMTAVAQGGREQTEFAASTAITLHEARWREAWDLKVFGYVNLTRAM